MMKAKNQIGKKPMTMKQWEKSSMDRKDDKKELGAENKKIKSVMKGKK